MPSNSLESVSNPRASLHGLAGAELTKLQLNALTSNQKDNCNARARLSAPDTHLMVIGYSFGDPHINDAIHTAATKGLKLFIINFWASM